MARSRLLDPATCGLLADALRKRLADLQRELPGVRRGLDPECVHRARVACRRLRVVLDLFPDYFSRRHAAWRREIRDLGRGLSQARDADVQILFLKDLLVHIESSRLRRGIKRLLLRRSQYRQRKQDHVRVTLDDFIRSRVMEDLDQARRRLAEYASTSGSDPLMTQLHCRAADMVADLARNLLAFDADAEHPDRAEALHDMRIAAKRLRYALELFRPLSPPEALSDTLAAVKTIQDHLGVFHDAEVWLGMLPEFLEDEQRRCIKFFGHARAFPAIRAGVLHFESILVQRRADAHAAFLTTWCPLSNPEYWERIQRLLLVSGPTDAAPPQSETPCASP